MFLKTTILKISLILTSTHSQVIFHMLLKCYQQKCGSSELTIWAPRAQTEEQHWGPERRGPPGRPPQPPPLPRPPTHSPSGSSKEGPRSVVRYMYWAFAGAIDRATNYMEFFLAMVILSATHVQILLPKHCIRILGAHWTPPSASSLFWQTKGPFA